jgi:hypothetical protein
VPRTNAASATTAAAGATTAAAATTAASSASLAVPGGLTLYPGSMPLSVTPGLVNDFLLKLAVTQTAKTRQDNRLEDSDLKNFEFNSQFETRASPASVKAGELADYYQRQAEQNNFTTKRLTLRDDPKLNVIWLVLEKPGTQVGVLIVEVRDTAEAEASFGAGKLASGDTGIFFTNIK